MFSFVAWKWSSGNPDREFHSEHVNVLASMLRRHCSLPHRLICVTDDARGLDSSIQAMPQPVTFDGVGSPQGGRFPSCYRRLWNFSHRAADAFGDRFMALDIDVVITRNIDSLIHRPESFVGWTDAAFKWNKVAGGIYLLRAGAHPEVWDRFDPRASPQLAYRAGCNGSDQGWMSYMLFPPPGSWGRADGLYSLKWLRPGAPLPAEVRVVSTPGALKPWSREAQRSHPWIKEHWQ